jgi:hypothetical protein
MTMKPLSALALCALLVAGACSKQPATETASESSAQTSVASADTNLTAEQLGELGAQIQKNPGDAQKLLSEKGLSEESFAQAVRKVSEDPAASQRYAAAYKRASA